MTDACELISYLGLDNIFFFFVFFLRAQNGSTDFITTVSCFQLRRQTQQSSFVRGNRRGGREKIGPDQRDALARREDAERPRDLPRQHGSGHTGPEGRQRQGRSGVQVPSGFQKIAHPQLQSQFDRYT